MLFSLVLLPTLISAMDDQQQQQQSTNDNNDSVSGEFLVHVHNAYASASYLALVNEFKTVKKWEKEQHKVASFEDLENFNRTLKPFKKFAKIMEHGKQKFPGTETSIKTQSQGRLFLINPEPPVKVSEFIAHYDASPFVYEIKVGSDEIEAYKKQVMEEDSKNNDSDSDDDKSNVSRQKRLLELMMMAAVMGKE